MSAESQPSSRPGRFQQELDRALREQRGSGEVAGAQGWRLRECSCRSGIAAPQPRCAVQGLEGTLHSVCSYSAVGNLCSALLCVELDTAWILFWCLSSITVLAGYILTPPRPPCFFLCIYLFWFVLGCEYCTHEFISLRTFSTRDAQTDLVVLHRISLIGSFGFHSW